MVTPSSALVLIIHFGFFRNSETENLKCIPPVISVKDFLSVKLKRFWCFLGQHDVFYWICPIQNVESQNSESTRLQYCLCPAWAHCKPRIDGNVIKPVTMEYFYIVVFLNHVNLAKLDVKAEIWGKYWIFCVSIQVSLWRRSKVKIIKILKQLPRGWDKCCVALRSLTGYS